MFLFNLEFNLGCIQEKHTKFLIILSNITPKFLFENTSVEIRDSSLKKLFNIDTLYILYSFCTLICINICFSTNVNISILHIDTYISQGLGDWMTSHVSMSIKLVVVCMSFTICRQVGVGFCSHRFTSSTVSSCCPIILVCMCRIYIVIMFVWKENKIFLLYCKSWPENYFVCIYISFVYWKYLSIITLICNKFNSKSLFR